MRNAKGKFAFLNLPLVRRNMMKKYQVILPIFFVIVLAITFFTQCERMQSPNTPEKEIVTNEVNTIPKNLNNIKFEHAVVEKSAKTLARGIALALSEINQRKMIRREIDQAENLEKILYLDEVLMKRAINSNQSLAEVVADKIGLKNSKEVFDLVSNISEKVDFYFPVDQHREKWNVSASVLVGYDPFWLRDDEIKDFIAYDSNGQEVLLPVTQPSEQPTLVIAPCNHPANHEHCECYSSESSTPIQLPDSNINQMMAVKLKFICIREFTIKENYENWWEGDMEIEFFCRNYNGWIKTAGTNNYVCCRFWGINENERNLVCSNLFSWNWFLYKLADDGGAYSSLDVVLLEDDCAECRPRDPWDPHECDKHIASFEGVWDGNQGTFNSWGAKVKLKAGDLGDSYPNVPNCAW